ncbi:hypothetical protein K438DRAFT_1966039 [Mycena galopus ATCC 62051]|nr:hypothetical protein K438DRAFT_1966039 [Mycena galopus ATCC 62051]
MSTPTDAPLRSFSQDTPRLRLVPPPAAKYLWPFPQHSPPPFIFFLLGTVFALSLLSTVATTAILTLEKQ